MNEEPYVVLIAPQGTVFVDGEDFLTHLAKENDVLKSTLCGEPLESQGCVYSRVYEHEACVSCLSTHLKR